MDEETTTAGRAPLDRADVRAALDPHSSPVVLASLAEDVPALRPLIATNPACPAHVLAWLKEHGEPSIDDGLARNPHAQRLGLTTDRVAPAALAHYGTDSHCPACGAPVAADAWVCGSCFEPFGAPVAVVSPGPLVTSPVAAAHRTDAVTAIGPRNPPPPPPAERGRHGPHVWPLVLLAVVVLAAAGWLLVRKRNQATVLTLITTTTAAPAPSTTVAATTTAVATTTTLAPVTTTAAPPPTTAAPTTAAPTTAAPATTAAPPPTTPAPATTAPPATSPPTPPDRQAVVLAQRLVDAYANADWPTVHALNPSDTRNDDGLAASYGALDKAFAMATNVSATTPTVFNLRLGLVYQLTENGVARTRLYCVHWDADVGASQVVRVTGVQLDERDGTLDPNSVKAELQSTCPGLALS